MTQRQQALSLLRQIENDASLAWLLPLAKEYSEQLHLNVKLANQLVQAQLGNEEKAHG